MTRHAFLTTVLILIANIERIYGLKPPQNVKIVGSKLVWKPSEDDSVLFSLQYKHTSKAENEWHNVSSHIGTTLQSFNITNEYYGAVFRVRAEKGNNTSEWVNSSLVQCVHVNTCAPVINLSVKPEMVFLTMGHMDESLEKEYGEHIKFNISFWNVDNGGKPEIIDTNEKSERFLDLESRKKYCFQVGYLHYDHPYGNVTEKKCVTIPETPEVAKQRAWLYTVLLALLIVAVCGACIFVFFRNHKKIKQFLQPLPLEIPCHYKEFLSGDFPLQVCPSPSSQSLRSYDMITVIENNNVEEKGPEEPI